MFKVGDLVSVFNKGYRCRPITKSTKRATRLMVKNKSLSYLAILAEIGLTTVECRRLHADLISCLKFLNGS